MLSSEERTWHAIRAYSLERELLPRDGVANYVQQYRIRQTDADKVRRIDLHRLVFGSRASVAGDAELSLEDTALARVADDSLLKYPWESDLKADDNSPNP